MKPCPTGKRSHATQQAAILWAARRIVPGRQRPYLCHRCKAWHLTHEPKRKEAS